MEFQQQPPPPYLSPLNDPNYSYFFDVTNDRNNYLLYFQSSMKELNAFNYNWVIHHNVNNIIQKMIKERYFYISEISRLNGRLCKSGDEITKLKTQISTVTAKTEFLQNENIELNFKIQELKGKMKSIKECEEMISTKNEEIEKLKENIQNLIKDKCSIIIDEVVEEHKIINELKQKLNRYERRKNRVNSEADKICGKCFVNENEQINHERLRKRRKLSTENNGDEDVPIDQLIAITRRNGKLRSTLNLIQKPSVKVFDEQLKFQIGFCNHQSKTFLNPPNPEISKMASYNFTKSIPASRDLGYSDQSFKPPLQYCNHHLQQ